MGIKIAAVTLALALLLGGCGRISMDGAPPVVADDNVKPQLPMPEIIPTTQAFYIAPDVSDMLFQFDLLQYDIDGGTFIYSYESEQMVTELVDGKPFSYSPAAPEGHITKVARLVSYNYLTREYTVIYESVTPNSTSSKSLFAHISSDMLYYYHDSAEPYMYSVMVTPDGTLLREDSANLLQLYEPELVYDEAFTFDDTVLGEPIPKSQVELVDFVAMPDRWAVFLKFKLTRDDTTAWRYLCVLPYAGLVYTPRFFDPFASDVHLQMLNDTKFLAYNDLDYHMPGEKVRRLTITNYFVDMDNFLDAPDPEQYLPDQPLMLRKMRNFPDNDEGREKKAAHQVASFISDYRNIRYNMEDGGLSIFQVYSYPMGSAVNFYLLTLFATGNPTLMERDDHIYKLELDVIPNAQNSFVNFAGDFYYAGTDGIRMAKNSKNLPQTLEKPGVFYYLLTSNTNHSKALAIGFETETAPPAINQYASTPLYHMAEAQVVELTVQP